MLLIGAGLMVRTLGWLNSLNPGFDPRNVLAAEASLQDARYRTVPAVNRLYTESLERLRRIPGVESAAVALTLPYERPLNNGVRTLDGTDRESTPPKSSTPRRATSKPCASRCLPDAPCATATPRTPPKSW